MVTKKKQYTARAEGARLFFSLCGEIDHHAAITMREEIDRRIHLEMPRSVILDFAAVSFADSSALGFIVGRLETTRAVGATLTVTGVTPPLSRMLSLSGLEKMEGLFFT